MNSVDLNTKNVSFLKSRFNFPAFSFLFAKFAFIPPFLFTLSLSRKSKSGFSFLPVGPGVGRLSSLPLFMYIHTHETHTQKTDSGWRKKKALLWKLAEKGARLSRKREAARSGFKTDREIQFRQSTRPLFLFLFYPGFQFYWE